MADAQDKKQKASGEVAEGHGEERRRRRVIGTVKSTKMDKTITVVWERYVRHPRFGKFVARRTNLHAHDAENTAKEGDLVEIVESRPLSKLKRWRLRRIVREGKIAR